LLSYYTVPRVAIETCDSGIGRQQRADRRQ
jgi:hypothetical protein